MIRLFIFSICFLVASQATTSRDVGLFSTQSYQQQALNSPLGNQCVITGTKVESNKGREIVTGFRYVHKEGLEKIELEVVSLPVDIPNGAVSALAIRTKDVAVLFSKTPSSDGVGERYFVESVISDGETINSVFSQFLPASGMYTFREYFVPAMVDNPAFEFLSEERIQRDGRELCKVEWSLTVADAGQQVNQIGTFLFDIANNWSLREATCKVGVRGSPFLYTEHMEIDYSPVGVKYLPVLIRQYKTNHKSTGDVVGRKVEYRGLEYDFSTVSSQEFDLSRYGYAAGKQGHSYLRLVIYSLAILSAAVFLLRWQSDNVGKALNRLCLRATTANGLTVLFAMVSIIAIGSTVAWALNPGARLLITHQPATVQIPENSQATCMIEVSNRSLSDLILTGAEVSCACTTLPPFPIRVDRGEFRNIPVEITSKSLTAGEVASVRLRFLGVCNDSNVELVSEVPYVVVEAEELAQGLETQSGLSR